MFGTNEVTGQKFFDKAPINSLLVVGIFYTLQGEGPLSGRPSVFVRLAKCNLTCSFCDTAFERGEWMTFDEVEQRAWHEMDSQVVEGHGDRSDVCLIITGGEPTLQPNLSGFLLHQAGKWSEVQIESNGLIERLLPLNTILVVSPKGTEPMLPVRGTLKRGHYRRPLPSVMQRADCLKFVVDADPLNIYHAVPDWAYQWMHEQEKPVYVSPMNHYQEGKPLQLMKHAATLEHHSEHIAPSFWTPGLLDRTRNEANHQHAADLCLKYGYRLSLQTHLFVNLP